MKTCLGGSYRTPQRHRQASMNPSSQPQQGQNKGPQHFSLPPFHLFTLPFTQTHTLPPPSPPPSFPRTLYPSLLVTYFPSYGDPVSVPGSIWSQQGSGRCQQVWRPCTASLCMLQCAQESQACSKYKKKLSKLNCQSSQSGRESTLLLIYVAIVVAERSKVTRITHQNQLEPAVFTVFFRRRQ